MIVMGFNNNKVYARNFQQNGYDTIYAINPDDGSVIWRSNFTVERGITWSAAFAPNGDLLLPGSSTRSIMRINHLNGDTVWTRYRIIPSTGGECICVYGNTVYAFEGSIVTPKRVMAIELSNGAIKYYSPALPGDGDQEIPFTIGPNGTIYVIRDGGRLHALRDNGSAIVELWNYATVLANTIAWTQFGCGPDSTLYVPNG
jgi:outer membrane protein assembly factor BamB